MKLINKFENAINENPLVAILRGVQHDEIVEIGKTLYDVGYRIIEIPLNSPDPYKSIEKLAKELGDKAIIGAGTVLTTQQVKDVKNAGGEIIVSPNVDSDVIRTTVAEEIISFPGYSTPTEAFNALSAGAHALKLFPAESYNPKTLAAHKTILPKPTKVFVVGGIISTNMKPWIDAGASGFGLGSSLYKPQYTPETIRKNAIDLINGYNDAIAS